MNSYCEMLPYMEYMVEARANETLRQNFLRRQQER